MTSQHYQTDTNRRIEIGKILNKNSELIVNALAKLGDSLYDSNICPIENHFNKMMIPVHTQTTAHIDELLIAQTQNPLYEEIANIFINIIQKDPYNKTKGLMDRATQTFPYQQSLLKKVQRRKPT